MKEPRQIAVRVTSRGPFDVGSVLWRDERGKRVCTVIAKATYALAPGEAAPIDVPLPLQEGDGHWDDDPTKSVHMPSDLAPFKRSAEVVVVGSAFAPEGRPARQVSARVVVGSVDKTLEAWGPRRFRVDGTVEEAPPQPRFPLRYEYAAGGADTDNPAGIDLSRAALRGPIPVPQVLPHLHEVKSLSDHIPRAGFGPIAAAWPSRAMLLGQAERAWLGRPDGSPMPQAFPRQFFQSAPEDQWLDRPLAPNELIVLEKLNAKHPRLVMSLSGLEARAVIAGASGEPLRLSADLLFIDTDQALCTLTYRGQIPLAEGTTALHVIVVAAPMGARLSPEDVQRLSEPPGGEAVEEIDAVADDDSDDGTWTVSGTVSYIADRPALPFGQPPGAAGAARGFPDGALPFQVQAQPTHDAPPSSLPARPPEMPPPPPPPPPRPPLISSTRLGPGPSAHEWDPSRPPPPVPGPAPTLGQQMASAAASAPAPSPPVEAPPKPDAASGASKGFEAAFGAPKGALPASSKGFGGAFGGAKPAVKGLESPDGSTAEAKAAPGASGAGKASMLSAKAVSDAAAHQERGREGGEAREGGRFADAPVRRLAVVDLLGFDPKIASRLRTMKHFASLLASTTRPRFVQAVDQPRVEPSSEDRDRMDILRILSCARSASAGEVRRALENSLEDLTDFDIPLVVVAGELRPSFDELETLRATIAVVQPASGGDKKIGANVALAQEALAASTPPRPDIALGLCRQIDQSAASLNLPPRYIASHVERLLVEERKWKRRTILGSPRVRAELTLPGGGDPLLVYLPDTSSASLPLLPAWPAIALCEIRPREDVAETLPEALLAVAFGRVLHGRLEG